jgi:hypothetical protein
VGSALGRQKYHSIKVSKSNNQIHTLVIFKSYVKQGNVMTACPISTPTKLSGFDSASTVAACKFTAYLHDNTVCKKRLSSPKTIP